MGEQVFVKVPGKERSLATIVRRTGLLTYEVESSDGFVRATHANQMVRFQGEALPGPSKVVETPPVATSRPQRDRRPPARFSP